MSSERAYLRISGHETAMPVLRKMRKASGYRPSSWQIYEDVAATDDAICRIVGNRGSVRSGDGRRGSGRKITEPAVCRILLPAVSVPLIRIGAKTEDAHGIAFGHGI